LGARGPQFESGRPDQTAGSEFSSSVCLNSTALKHKLPIWYPSNRVDAPWARRFGGMRVHGKRGRPTAKLLPAFPGKLDGADA